jgi:tetratricopeptide (TPR) repeat protein
VLVGDDEAAIAQNTTIRLLSSFGTVLSPPADTTVAARPLANLTFAINYALAGGTANLWGYHAFNLAVHCLAAIGLFGIVRRTLRAPALRDRFGEQASMMIAFAVVAVWIAHPLHTQAVTFLAQRVESLMGFFYVATIYSVIRAAESGFQSRGWTIAAVVACALGMATKETMITAPLLAALWIWVCWPQEKLLGRPRPLLIGLAAMMVIAFALASMGARSGSAGFGAGAWTSWSYLMTQAGVIVHYISLAFWPNPLVFQYGWLPADSWRAVMPQLLVLGLLAAGTAAAAIRRMPIALIGVWFFLILAPSSSIVPISTEVAAEHRMYLPLAAIVAAVVLGTLALWRAARSPAPGLSDYLARIALVLVVLFLTLATRERNNVYSSAELIAADVVRNRPQNPHARLTYGSYLVGEKRFAEAEVHLRAALELPLPPSTDETKAHSLAHMYLGMALVSQNKPDEGSRELEQAIALRPDLDRAYPMLAEAQLGQRQPANAVATLERARARRPDDAALHKHAAWILATSSDDGVRSGSRAIQHAERAVALTGARDPIAFDRLAAAHAEAKQFDQALAALAKAVELIRANGPADMIPMLREHLLLLEARRPIRTPGW